MVLFAFKSPRTCSFESKALEGIFVGYGLESRTYRIFDKASGRVIESSSVVFEENDGSHVGQVDVCADAEIPQDTIGRMGVGFIRPIEGHLVADREELCSTQVEPSSSQTQPIPAAGTNVEPIQRQTANPPQDDLATSPRADHPAPMGGLSGPSNSNEDGVSPGRDQDQNSDNDEQFNDQGQSHGQDRDQNDQDDQAIPPRSNEEIEARRKARVERTLELRGHTLDKVIGDVRGKLSTKRQLASFYEHQAHISMVEP